MTDDFAIRVTPKRPTRRRIWRWIGAAFVAALVAATVAIWPAYVDMRLRWQHWTVDAEGVAYRQPNNEQFAGLRYPDRPGRYAAFLRYRPDWTHIRLRDVVVTPRDASDLARARQIRELSFEGCVFEKGVSERLAPLRNLTRLKIVSTKIDPSELRSLSALPALESLVLGGFLVDLSALEAVSTLTDLKELVIRCRGLRSADIQPLSGLPNLERLSLAGSDVDLDIMPVIRSMPKLRELDLRDTLTPEWIPGFGVPKFPEGMQVYGVPKEPFVQRPMAREMPREEDAREAFFNPASDQIIVPAPAEPIEVDIDAVLEAVN